MSTKAKCEFCDDVAFTRFPIMAMTRTGLIDSGRKLYACDLADHYVKAQTMANKGMGEASPVKGKR